MALGWGIRKPCTREPPGGRCRAGDVGRPDPDDNPAPGSRIRSIRALDLGLGGDVGRLPCARRGYRLADRGGAAGCGAVQPSAV
jgi:hypothetical protein